MGMALWLIAAATPVAAPAPEDPATIVVTGERVKRSLKETSSSVAVTREAEIEASGANRVDQVLALIPNVQLGNGSQGPAIRGLDTTGALNALPAFLGGNRPRTTIVVDGRAVTYNEFVFGGFPVWDVNRIEVFRSPQTTTQGQNSIAGAIFIDTNDPSFTPEYRGRGIVGDFHMSTIGPCRRNIPTRALGSFASSSSARRIPNCASATSLADSSFEALSARALRK